MSSPDVMIHPLSQVSPGLLTATDVQLRQRASQTVIDRYRRNSDWKYYQKEWIYRNFPPRGKSWLDFGCGTGEIATQLALLGARRVVALDVTPGLLKITQEQVELDGVSDRVRVVCGDIADVEPEPVDVALAYAVLHHVPDRLEEIVKSIRRWLKPGGTFIFCEPVCFLPLLEWLRNHSGVHQDPLDPGERKLTSRDIRTIESQFSYCQRTYFHTFGRLARVAPAYDRKLRAVDSLLRSVPGAGLFAGCLLGACQL